MGLGGSKKGEESRVRMVHPNKATVDAARKNNRLVQVLLQGTGESGKSTILQQMQLIYGEGFDDEYKQTKKDIMMLNYVNDASTVLHVLEKEEKAPKDEAAAALVLNTVAEMAKTKSRWVKMTPELAKALATLSSDPFFVQAVNGEAKSMIQDNFVEILANFEHFPDWGGKKWLPSNQDLLETRIRTIGVAHYYFKVNELLYSMIDVGGQKGERRQHLKLFADVNQVLFVASLSDYDQNLYESPDENRLVDSLGLFENLTRNTNLAETTIILFLNKYDIFQKKYMVDKVPLPVLEGFNRPPLAENDDEKCSLALNWFKQLYVGRAPPGRIVDTSVHVTIATESGSMEKVITSITAEYLQIMFGV